MKKYIALASTVLLVNTSISSTWGMYEEYDFSSPALLTTKVGSLMKGDADLSRIARIMLNVPGYSSFDSPKLKPYLVKTDGTKVFLSSLENFDGQLGKIYTLNLGSDKVYIRFDNSGLDFRVGLGVKKGSSFGAICSTDREKREVYNKLGDMYKKFGVELTDGTSKEMSISFKNKDNVSEEANYGANKTYRACKSTDELSTSFPIKINKTKKSTTPKEETVKQSTPTTPKEETVKQKNTQSAAVKKEAPVLGLFPEFVSRPTAQAVSSLTDTKLQSLQEKFDATTAEKRNAPLSRGDFLKIVIDASPQNVSYVNTKNLQYSDVKKDSELAKYIAFATQYNIISGYEDGTFQSDKKISRAEATKILMNTLKVQIAPEVRTFTDIASDNSLGVYVQTAYDLKLINGTSETTFEPNNIISKGELIKIVFNILNNA